LVDRSETWVIAGILVGVLLAWALSHVRGIFYASATSGHRILHG
jgi:hypothetical protein